MTVRRALESLARVPVLGLVALLILLGDEFFALNWIPYD